MSRKIIVGIVIVLLGTLLIVRTIDNPLLVEAQTTCPNKVRGDANCDNSVNESDYVIWRCEFYGSGNCDINLTQLIADFNADQTVDMIDFEIWRSNQGIEPTTTPTTIPGKADMAVQELTNYCITFDGDVTITAYYDFLVKNSGAVASPTNTSELIFTNPNFGINNELSSFDIPALAPDETHRVNSQKDIICPLCGAFIDPDVGINPVLGVVIALDRNNTIDEENELNNAPNYVGELCASIPENPTITQTPVPTITPSPTLISTPTNTPSPTLVPGAWTITAKFICPNGQEASAANYASNWRWFSPDPADNGEHRGSAQPIIVTGPQLQNLYQLTAFDNYNARELSVRVSTLPPNFFAIESNLVVAWNGAAVPFGSYTVEFNTSADACQ